MLALIQVDSLCGLMRCCPDQSDEKGRFEAGRNPSLAAPSSEAAEIEPLRPGTAEYVGESPPTGQKEQIDFAWTKLPR